MGRVAVLGSGKTHRHKDAKAGRTAMKDAEWARVKSNGRQVSLSPPLQPLRLLGADPKRRSKYPRTSLGERIVLGPPLKSCASFVRPRVPAGSLFSQLRFSAAFPALISGFF